MITTMLHGASMALADSVPGVSGGTIAFILGFYERLLGAIHDFVGGSREERKQALRYLVKFAIGWTVGMGGSVVLLSRFFDSNIYFLSSMFLGLTLGAIPFILYQERSCLQNRWQNGAFTLLGIVLVVAMSFFRSFSGGVGAVRFQSLTLLQGGYLILCGALAISAMLLPGISGSTLLLIFGVYVPAVNAVKEVLHLHLEYLPGVLALAAGVLLGVVFAANLIRKALRVCRSQMVYLILGLMLGSLYAIALGPTTLDVPQASLSPANFQPLGFLLGILVLTGLEWMKKIGTQIA